MRLQAGKDRYVFFSFPHIAIDSRGTVGNISRPGRPGPSAACGALKGAQGLLANGISANESEPGGDCASMWCTNQSIERLLHPNQQGSCFRDPHASEIHMQQPKLASAN